MKSILVPRRQRWPGRTSSHVRGDVSSRGWLAVSHLWRCAAVYITISPGERLAGIVLIASRQHPAFTPGNVPSNGYLGHSRR
jgi:hypothetical protein